MLKQKQSTSTFLLHCHWPTINIPREVCSSVKGREHKTHWPGAGTGPGEGIIAVNNWT